MKKHDSRASTLTGNADDPAPAAGKQPEVFGPEEAKVINTYGLKPLTSSIISMMKKADTSQKIMKQHLNSVVRLVDDCTAQAALKSVLAFWLMLCIKLDKEDLLINDSSEDTADFLADRVIGKPIKPGTLGLLVSGRPEAGTDGSRLPDDRYAYMVAQSKMGLTLGKFQRWLLKSVCRLPAEYIDGVETTNETDIEGVDMPEVKPISYRDHLKQAWGIVEKAVAAGLNQVFDIVMMDNSGRFHVVSRTSHQGPSVIRGLHTAPTLEECDMDALALMAMRLKEEGVCYTEARNVYCRKKREAMMAAGVDPGVFALMYKFDEAVRTGKTDWLFEGDMNLSLGFIKACFKGCETSMVSVGALCGWLCPNTWNKVCDVSSKASDCFKAFGHLMRKVAKACGTPMGYGAAVRTAGVAVLGLTGKKIGKDLFIRSTDDLYVKTYDSETGKLNKRILWDVVPLDEVLPLCDPKVIDVFRKRLEAESPGSELTVYTLVSMAEEVAAAVKDGMDEVLPCLKSFDDWVLPHFKALMKKGLARKIKGSLGWTSYIPKFRINDQGVKQDVTANAAGRRRKSRFLKPVLNKSSLAAGPYIVFLIESAAMVLLWVRTRHLVPFQKGVHDAILINVVHARYMCKQHGLAIIDTVEKFDLSQLPEFDKDGLPYLNLEARTALLERAREEANVWGLPSEEDLQKEFPNLSEWVSYQRWLLANVRN